MLQDPSRSQQMKPSLIYLEKHIKNSYNIVSFYET